MFVRTWILQMSAHPVITPFLPSQVPPCLAAVPRTSATLLPWSIMSSQPLLNCRVLSCSCGPPFGEATTRPAAFLSAFPWCRHASASESSCSTGQASNNHTLPRNLGPAAPNPKPGRTQGACTIAKGPSFQLRT